MRMVLLVQAATTKVLRRLLVEWWRHTVPHLLRVRGVEVDASAKFYGMPIVELAKGSRIRIGKRVVLCSDSRFTALGVNHPVVLRTLNRGANITIGDDCGISGGSICSSVSVTVGRDCLFGANVTVADTDFHAISPVGRRFNNRQAEISAAAVNIGSNVFLGTGAVVLKGVSIGENSVVGAAALVIKDVPANSVVGGNPAIVIRGLIN